MKHTPGKMEAYDNAYDWCIQGCRAEVPVLAVVNRHLPPDEQKANAERIAALWNAADGMSNEDGVKALENHKVTKIVLKQCVTVIEMLSTETLNSKVTIDIIKELLAKLEDK